MSINERLAYLLQLSDKLNERIILLGSLKLIREYQRVQKYIQNEVSKIYKAAGSSASELARGDRLKKIELLVQQEINTLKGTTNESILSNITEGYQKSYSYTGFAFEKSLQVDLGFAILDDFTIRSAVFNPLDKVDWQTSNRYNIEVMKTRTRNEIVNGLTTGRNYGQTASAIDEQLNIGINKAVRIVWTETHKAQQAGRNFAISEAKNFADEVRMDTAKVWMATLDSHTRPNHGDMDGKTANEQGLFDFVTMDGALIQVEGPGLTNTTDDIHCRCTASTQFANIPYKIRRDAESGEVIPYKTYNEWYAEKYKKAS